jgi:Ser/Thr protein kinase RdoA (MazF antagonist)
MNQEQLAYQALEAYPINSPAVIFLRHNENLTFRVLDEQTKDAYLLRIHSPSTAAFQVNRLRPAGIASELQWLEALAEETSLVLQRPVRARDGALVVVVKADQRAVTCSLLHWIEGEPFPEAPSQDQARRLGAIIATLHEHACHWTVPDTFARPLYNLAFYRQQINSLIEGVRNGVIREGDFARIQETLERILKELADAQEPLILIHADLWRGNWLASKSDVHPIDFSLCGYGLPLFDLGTCLAGIPTHLRPALLDAYQQQRALSPAYPRLIDACFLLSRMGAYVYLLANPAEHAWLKERIPRFIAQECRLFLAEAPLLFGGPF